MTNYYVDLVVLVFVLKLWMAMQHAFNAGVCGGVCILLVRLILLHHTHYYGFQFEIPLPFVLEQI